MPSIFSYQSSEIDWCENNFVRSPIIAEYYNTISNVCFFILSAALLHLNRQYCQQRTVPMYFISGLLLCVGIFSMYFHMTLSYVGQLLDELSILWTLAVAYSFWYPRAHFPKCIKSRKHFYWLGGVTTVITTVMSFIKPSINAYALNCIAFHLLYLTWRELKKCNDQRVHRMAKAMVVWWVLAITSWLSDRWLCWLCQAINFPYFHSFWHVLIAVSLLYCFPLVMYFDVTYEMPAFKPKLGYWPSDSWPIVVPYIALEDPHKQC
ncbi:alkaline ceramidase 1 [Gallus gallus]|uniref:Alkaline ceramidase n=1 Tax=Gallus gallus TaxID=9031 RepID=A0A8V1AJC8_CHICK|nr:alkaline ceramidase 1 [Gallus gallus]XP_040509592.1 alkaline ceramidase 1 [Gallus gallus]XP_040548563.1 alkaline ceramidase 1 [Gallus gallus]XP_040548564.1 alkaline ceramidase 1 [Gallus gallus]XP_040548565.1 alkaline ceramidase 1 [Gallus gallus]XP_418208.2 alkaline ceramidase 1 [Gallus gallus]|eukprot:XP_004948808.1 alkaline ceramidase 1 [Gallus gallus]